MLRLFTFLLIVFPLFANSNGLPKESIDSAESMFEQISKNSNTGKKIRQNSIDPLTSDKKMKTYDGSKDFDVNLLCSGSNTFADFMVAPLANGNVQIVNIRQDTDMDGVIDSYQTPNWEASAICTNGYMYCSDQGDPTTCRSYEWMARDADYLVSPMQTAMSHLGGCYCVNNACGSNLVMRNIDTVVRDIGTGIAASLAEKHHFFNLTSVEIDGVYGKLKGSDSSSCNPASADSVLGTEEVEEISKSNYANDTNKLKNDGFAAQADNELFQKLSQSAEDTNFEYRSCTVKRVSEEDKVETQDIIAFDSGTGGLYEIGTDKMRIILGTVGDNYWPGSCTYYKLQTNFYVYRPDRIKKAQIKRAKFDDWIQVHVVNDNEYTHVWNGPYGNWTDAVAKVPGSCELSTSWDKKNINHDFSSAFSEVGPVKFRVRVEVTGGGEGYLLGDIDLDTGCKILPDKIVNTCETYQNNNKCTLIEEEVDDVKTFSNGYGTGLYPLPKDIGPLCGVEQKRDWVLKERTYRCESDYAYDFEAGFDRMEYVKDKSNIEKWKDKTTNYEDGSVAFDEGSFPRYDGLGAQACTMTCKTRKERVMNDMTLSGTTGKEHNVASTYDFFYHQCTGTNDDVCPTEEGEEVIKACQCLNEFSEATAVMQALRMAGQDMICTDGSKVMPDGEQME